MKAYLVTSGAAFGLLALVHLWRLLEEWPHLATDPWFLVITVAAATMGLWAMSLFRRARG